MLPVFIITGPTASGKTGAAIRTVEFLSEKGILCEIINADSIQLYKDLKILTAFPTKEEQQRAKHLLFGILDPYETYSVAKWRQIATEQIDKLHKEGKIPILCGGTGFYLKSIVEGMAYIPDVPPAHRQKVFEEFQEIGRERFVQELQRLDPSSKLHMDDTQRILRAYEVVTFTGKPLSYWWAQNHSNKYEDVRSLVILPEKTNLKKNILSRAIGMIEDGAIEEVKEFMSRHPDYQGPLDRVIGFSEIRLFLKQEINKDQLIEHMFIKTRQYAKRQSTWFRHQMKNITFVEQADLDIIDQVFQVKNIC